MAAFNLTAEINLRGPSNLNRVVANIRRQLSTVSLNLNINQSAVRNIQGATSQLQNLNNVLISATANANSLNAALSNLSASIGNAANGMNNLGGGLNNVNNQINAVNRNTQQGAAGMEEFGRQAALAVRRFAAFSVATGGIYALVRAISSGYNEFLVFNKELVRLQQVTGGTANSLQAISNEITRLSTSLGVTSTDLLTVSSTLAQAGLSATETKTALEALAKSALAPSFDNLNDTVEGSIALMRQFGIGANDLESSLGSVNAVAAAFAVESGDIIKAIQRTGGVFAAASKGVTQGKDALNEFVALFTSVRQTTRESAETIATGLRTIFTRIQRGGTIQALKEYGITLTDLENKFVGPFEAVRRLSEGLQALDPRDLRFSQIVEELGGFRQIGKVIPLIQQFATAQQALGVAQRGAGSLAEAAATAQGSLAVKITKVREEFIALIRDIGQSDSFQKFADISLQLASALISVASAAKDVLPALAALAAIRSIPAIGQFVGGFGRGLTRRNQGGPIRAFAAGGFVPGSGNRDTVPAMLTPGEFVIRKKAVEKIGVGSLARLNRNNGGPIPNQYFNDRGEVQKFVGGGKVAKLISQKPSLKKYYDTGKNKIYDQYEMPDIRRDKLKKSRLSYREDAKKIVDEASSIYRKTKSLDEANKFITEKTGGLSARLTRKDLRGKSPVKYNKVQGALAELTVSRQYRKKNLTRLPYKGGADFATSKTGFIEVKNKIEATDDKELISKALLGYANRNSKPKDYFRDGMPTNVPKLKIILKSTNPADINKNLGGYIQKFMAGKFVKSTQKPKTISPADLLIGPGGIEAGVWSNIKREALTAKKLALGSGGRSIIFPDGEEIDFKKVLDANPSVAVKTALSNAGLQPKELREELTKRYLRQRAAVVSETGDRSPEQIKSAMSQKLLFGAAGMFGRKFAPRPLKLKQSDGLKQDMDAVVFGSVLDRDGIARKTRLEKRKMLFQASGSPRGFDSGAIDIAAAPTADQLTKSFQKESSSVVGKQNKTLAKNYIQAIASSLSPSTGGSRIFLDFDRTLAFGADKIVPKTKGTKKPDYSAFSDISKVSAGLNKAKLSGLGIRIKKILSTLDKQQQGLSKELLDRMFVVSARPPKTMPLIARWIRNQGIRIPPSNVKGVGGTDVPTEQIGLRKAETISQLGLSSGGVFIDDDPSNVAAVKDKIKNIRSIEYGYSPDKSDQKVRQQMAVQEGYQFEKYINERLPANLKTAIFKEEGEGIDFPFGLDSQTAKYWFNDMRLVGVPVDTKRTISGPSTIKSNVVSYLKQQGFADGGLVQKFMGGEYVEGSALKALKDMVREFLMPRSRKGGRRKISFIGQKAVNISKQLPPGLLKQIEEEGRLVYGTGIGTLPKGDPGLVVDKIISVALAKTKKRKAGQLKKTQGALTFSAAGLQRGPKAPPGQMEKALAAYEKNPEYRKIMGLDSGIKGGLLKQFEAQAKQKIFSSPKPILDKIPDVKSRLQNFRTSLQESLKGTTDPKDIKSLNDQIRKASTAIDDIDEYLAGGSPKNAGRATHFAWAMRQAIPEAVFFAKGGSVGDTVPALLTPGEFVINKKAAKRIGSAKLHKLNKADKIQGFNKGGAVGDIQSFASGGGVQRFFVGGLVQTFTGLARSVSQLIPIFRGLGTATTAVTRNMAAQQAATFRQQGLSGAALKNAMINAGYGPGGINNMRTRNQMNQMATQRANTAQGGDGSGLGMGLMFLGPMIAESINSAITSGGGPISKAVGSSITSIISGVTIGSAFTSFLGPWGMVIGAVAGAGAALLNWTKAVEAAETVEKEKIIENKAQALEKSFERLSKSVDKVDIGKIQESIVKDIRSVLAAQQVISNNTVNAAQPSIFGRMLGYEIDTTSLSKDLAQAAAVSGTNIQRYIEYGMSRGQNFDELLNKFGDTGRESLAINRAGPELTLIKALAEEARASGKKQSYGGKQLTAEELDKKYAQRIIEINNEFKKAAIEQQEAQKTLNAVTIAVDNFAVAIRKLESIINRSSAEFIEAQRVMDINFGNMFGEEAKIAGPSRLNENILENPAAYNAQEIASAITDLGQNLRFSPEFTQKLETATISKSVIQSGLPQILAEAAAAQKSPGGLAGASETAIINKLEQLFKNVPGMNAGDATEAASRLFESIQDRLQANKDISLSELSTNDPALNKIMESYNNTVDAAAKAQTEYNQLLNQVNSRLNQYVSALERAAEAQNQAATIRTEGQNTLTEALGGGLSLQQLNKSFEDTLLTLTSRIGGNGLAIRGTGTIDADTISRRLSIESDRLKNLQSQKAPAAGTAAFDKYNKDLINATLSVRNLTKAQEKLANDTTRAANALSKIQSIRQAQESRRGTFDDILRNLNNPEWMMQFVGQVQSLERVQAGRGNIMDIGPALDALQQRLAGMADQGEREAERTKFYDNIGRILEKSGFNRADIDNALRIIGNRGEQPDLTTAIEQYTEALEQQAKALENSGKSIISASKDFYTEIIRAANDFVVRIGQVGALPAAGQVEASRGGLIYASKGQLINYQPKGTDTVPAMLTPGEFVVNKKATQKNLGLLKSINNGSDIASQKEGMTYARTGGEILDSLRGDSYLLRQLGEQSISSTSEFDRKTAENNRRSANVIKNRILASLEELEYKTSVTLGLDDDNLFKDIFTYTDFFKITDPESIRILPPAKFNDWRNSISQAIIRAEELDLRNLIDTKNGSLLAQPISANNQPVPQNPNPPEPKKDVPSPDYYDELTYKEYLDNLVRSGNEPQPPIRSKFTTDAFYTETGVDRVVGQQTKQDILDKLYNEHGISYEIFKDNINNNVWPEKAVLDSAYRQQLITAAKSFENYLNFENIPIPAPYEDIETISNRARITAFDSRLVGPINGGVPPNLADIDKLKEVGTMFEAYVNGSVRDVREYLSLKNKKDADPENVKALANIIKKNYEGAINSLKSITELSTIFKNGKNIVPNDTGKDIGLNSLVSRLKSYVKPTYKTSLKDIGQENINFDDSLLDIFESKYAQMVAQNAQRSAVPVKGKDVVDRMTPQQKSNIRGRKSARSQYDSSLVYYKYARGKYNRQSMLGQRRAAYLSPSVGRPQMLNSGGVVYASNGQLINFQPRGTDTVPAMLTPGEFVVNAKATKNNLGLLQSINNGAKGYSSGGVVYLEKGGFSNDTKIPYDISSTNFPESEERAKTRKQKTLELQQEIQRRQQILKSNKDKSDSTSASITFLDMVIKDLSDEIAVLEGEFIQKQSARSGFYPMYGDVFGGVAKDQKDMIGFLNLEKSRLQEKLALSLLGEDSKSWLTRLELLAKEGGEIGVGIVGGIIGATALSPTTPIAGPVGSAAGAAAGYVGAVNSYKALLGEEYQQRLQALQSLYPVQSFGTNIAPAALAVGSAAKLYQGLKSISSKKAAAVVGGRALGEVAGDLGGTFAGSALTGQQFSPGVMDVVLAAMGVDASKKGKLKVGGGLLDLDTRTLLTSPEQFDPKMLSVFSPEIQARILETRAALLSDSSLPMEEAASRNHRPFSNIDDALKMAEQGDPYFAFIKELLDSGMSRDDIVKRLKENPNAIVGDASSISQVRSQAQDMLLGGKYIDIYDYLQSWYAGVQKTIDTYNEQANQESVKSKKIRFIEKARSFMGITFGNQIELDKKQAQNNNIMQSVREHFIRNIVEGQEVKSIYDLLDGSRELTSQNIGKFMADIAQSFGRSPDQLWTKKLFADLASSEELDAMGISGSMGMDPDRDVSWLTVLDPNELQKRRVGASREQKDWMQTLIHEGIHGILGKNEYKAKYLAWFNDNKEQIKKTMEENPEVFSSYHINDVMGGQYYIAKRMPNEIKDMLQKYSSTPPVDASRSEMVKYDAASYIMDKLTSYDTPNTTSLIDVLGPYFEKLTGKQDWMFSERKGSDGVTNLSDWTSEINNHSKEEFATQLFENADKLTGDSKSLASSMLSGIFGADIPPDISASIIDNFTGRMSAFPGIDTPYDTQAFSDRIRNILKQRSSNESTNSQSMSSARTNIRSPLDLIAAKERAVAQWKSSTDIMGKLRILGLKPPPPPGGLKWENLTQDQQAMVYKNAGISEPQAKKLEEMPTIAQKRKPVRSKDPANDFLKRMGEADKANEKALIDFYSSLPTSERTKILGNAGTLPNDNLSRSVALGGQYRNLNDVQQRAVQQAFEESQSVKGQATTSPKIETTAQVFAGGKPRTVGPGLTGATTGWKFRLNPVNQDSQAKIQAFLEKNKGLLDSYKWDLDMWTAYVGNADDLEKITKLINSELLQTGVATSRNSAGDKPFNGVFARFDIRDIPGLKGQGFQVALQNRIAEIKKSRGFTTNIDGTLNAGGASSDVYQGLPTTRRLEQLLLSLKETKRTNATPDIIEKLQRAIDGEVSIIRQAMEDVGGNFYSGTKTPTRLQNGGLIYASKGQLIPYEPKGTDTVPAMLTPGEFVVNARATKKNLGLLKAINGGAKGYSSGGVVYLESGGMSGDPPPELEIDRIRLRSLRDELKQYEDKERRKPKYRQKPISGPYPLIRDIGGILKQIKIAPPGFNNDSWISQIRDITEISAGQVAMLSSDSFVAYIGAIDRAVEAALKVQPTITAPQPLQPSVFPPGGQNQIMTNPSVAPATGVPAGGAPAGGAPATGVPAGGGGPLSPESLITTPKYYDELTYKEWLDTLIAMSWEKFESGKYDEMPGPMPPEQARFVTPALYYDKDQANDPNADVKIKAQQKAEEWKKQYEGWRDYILKARQSGNNPPIPVPDGGASSAEQEDSWLSNFESWTSGYMQIPQEEIRAVMANAKMRLGFPARSTAYDTRYTGGLIGEPRQTSAIPEGLPQEEILRTATALKAEIDNAQKEYQVYSDKKEGPQPQTKEDAEIQTKALEISAKSYTDAIGFLTELSTKTNVFRKGYQSFETNLGKNLNIPTAIGSLKDLRQNIAGEGRNIDIDDSIIDTYFAERARIIEQNAPEDLVDPAKPELGTRLPDKPIRGKDIPLTDTERKSIRGAKGPLSQYRSSLIYYKNARGKYNRQLMLAQKRLAYNQEKERRRDEFNSPRRGLDAQAMSNGGVVYASNGQYINYQPRGTDTVPAMLTPGEFVVNRKATKNNLDLLKSINSNNYNTGGIVNPIYLQNGTSSSGSSGSPVSLNGVSIPLDTGSFDSGVDKFGSSIDQLTGAINQFVSGGSSIANALAGFSNVANAFTTLSTVSSLLSGTTSGLTSAISQFNSSVTRMSESLSSIPDTISLNITGAIPVNVTVTVNGGEGLDEKLSSFEDAIYNEIASEMARATAGKNQIKLNFSTTRK